VLHRAFAKPELPVPPPGNAAGALDLALRFDLAARIGARAIPGTLKAEIGPAADEIVRALHLTAANSLRYEATLRQVAGLAASRGIPLVILKGSAIGLLGISAPGARPFSDLDILVPVDRILELRTALVAAGWTLSGLDGSEHQEAPLTHPAFGMIELHHCIPGIRPPGSRRSFDARGLLDAGLTDSLPGLDGAVRAPSRPVLIAHALEHGLVQHGYAPGSYPLFRLLADLQDLGTDTERLREAGQFLRDLDPADLSTVASLLAALEAGAAFDLHAGPPRSLLDHLVAGTLIPAYALGLKADPRALRSPSDLPLPLATLRWIYKATVLDRAHVDAIYGRPKRLGGYAARQLLRPFDLALRLGRSVRAGSQKRPSMRSQ
jgi:hypothetical protein